MSELRADVLVALVGAMTPQELINNLSSLKKRGALEHEEVERLVTERLEAAKSDRRVSAFKVLKAAEASDADVLAQVREQPVEIREVAQRLGVSRLKVAAALARLGKRRLLAPSADSAGESVSDGPDRSLPRAGAAGPRVRKQ